MNNSWEYGGYEGYDESALPPIEACPGLPSDPGELVSEARLQQLEYDLAELQRQRRSAGVHPRYGISGVLAFDVAVEPNNSYDDY